MKSKTPKLLTVLVVILIASVFRILPHWPNFTPLAAIALMSGAFISNKRLALVMPLLAMFISDLLTITLMNSYWTSVTEYLTNPGTMLIYVSFFLMTLIGFKLKNRQSNGSLALSALACSVLFFVLSNFGVWMVNELPKNLAGLSMTYLRGIPFFGYDLAGNIFYAFASFGLIKVLVNTWPALRTQQVKN